MTQKIIFVVFSIAFLSICFFSLPDKDSSSDFFISYSYIILCLLLIIWAIAKLKYQLWSFDKVPLKTFGISALFALVSTLAIVFGVESGFKVFADEPNLAGVSKSLYETGKPLNVLVSLDGSESILSSIPKRPLLYSFLTHFMHYILGYSHFNGIYLNWGLCFGLLLSLSLFLTIKVSASAALLANIFILANPIFCISACSGGFELLSLGIAALCLGLFYQLLKYPDQEKTVSFAFFAALLLLVHTRYEMPLLAVALFLIALFKSRNFKDYLSSRYHWLLPLGAFTTLPVLWQRRITFFEQEAEAEAFSFSFILEHLEEFLAAHGKIISILPFPHLLHLYSFGISFYLFYLWLKKRRLFVDANERVWFITTGLWLDFSTLLVLSFHAGSYLWPPGARYFLFLSVALSLIPLYLFNSRSNKISLYALGIFSLLIYFPVATKMEHINSGFIKPATEASYKYLEDFDKTDLLVVSRNSGFFTLLNLPASNFHYLSKPEVRDKLQQFKTLLVFQRFLKTNAGGIVELDEMPKLEGFQLKKPPQILISGKKSIRALIYEAHSDSSSESISNASS